MSMPASDLARRLALRAEEVCRYYLSHGRREANIGSWATSGTRPAGRFSSVSGLRARAKAPLETPRRALGRLRGNGI